ncbi:OmpH family outer membrane protein [bacterium]|nr:OmpH family outer membrane protein [bacterium]
MKKTLSTLAVTAALLSGLTFGTAAQAADFSVAIVDVPVVVNASAQVQALKKEQQAKAKEIVQFIEKARKDVASISDAKKKQAAEEKYNKELQAKKEKMDKDYAAKLQAIDESISAQIAAKAKADGYNVVLSKSIVLYGGTDITADVAKIIK